MNLLRRSIDIFGALVCILLTLPIVPFVALAIALTDRGPVFYRQTRAGYLGKPFTVLKFRSMRINTLAYDNVTEITSDHPLVTPIGAVIRRYKIDELPQILNVLRGEMSLIGPRPTIMEQVAAYTPFQMRRLNVLPGLSGWAQINGGINITWEERIQLDVWYVDHRSLLLDAKILLQTFLVILRGDEARPEPLAMAAAHAQQFEQNHTEMQCA